MLTSHKTLVIAWLMYVQNSLQPSFVGPFDVVGPIGICLQSLCHNPALVVQYCTFYHLSRLNRGIVMHIFMSTLRNIVFCRQCKCYRCGGPVTLNPNTNYTIEKLRP